MLSLRSWAGPRLGWLRNKWGKMECRPGARAPVFTLRMLRGVTAGLCELGAWELLLLLSAIISSTPGSRRSKGSQSVGLPAEFPCAACGWTQRLL